MAADFIKINTSNPLGTQANLLVQYKSQLRAAYELGTRIRAIMRHNFDDQVNPIDWAQVEELFGIPAGQGESVFTLMDGSVGAMEGQFQNSASKDLTERIG